MTFILKKKINYLTLEKYLKFAHDTNQFSNGGYATKFLEERAREILKISDSKAVIATSSGTAALHAILYAMMRQENRNVSLKKLFCIFLQSFFPVVDCQLLN